MYLIFLSLFALSLFAVLVQSVFFAKNFHWDVMLVAYLHHHPLSGKLHKLLYAITLLANTETVLALLAILMFFSLWFKISKYQVALLTLNVAIAAVVEITIKHQFDRIRPNAVLEHIHLSTYSFPSGHAMLSVCFYGLIFYFLSKRFPTAKTLISGIAILLALFIGVSRFLLEVHYVSDVLGGYLIAIPILCLGIYLNNLSDRIQA